MIDLSHPHILRRASNCSTKNGVQVMVMFSLSKAEVNGYECQNCISGKAHCKTV